jgi:hypothetical protein
MNDFLELLPVPAERDLPSGRFVQRKAALLQLVEADLQSGRKATPLGRWRHLRVWLLSIGIGLALIATASSTLLVSHVRPQTTRVAVATVVALGGGPVVASFVRGIGGGRASVRILLPAGLG